MYRSREHRIIAGVCGGLADKMGLPPTLVRILWLLLSLIPGPLWVVYVVMWILVPEEPKGYRTAA
ncbi:phage shock protein PspC (stress-responsive transcriptional regulator) [Nonomuraea thailandensis]|jgi:phage shock protein PspC (stress-responsive transcriptional regulator)|uniref:Phage shock protein PspC (Stress-responsive transcriptional regulator) n=1 Tax=Nonomuraea thailandensis TaxID=1188745 RepID=A0A9X2GR93_9ACTN|nr:PspC domain-containing protein [Nonomuraea thailandensis]MCP2362535.1 phage shock protein PspC (stress-responsive transcriptional regulator) [Nonomuraea thailandensis]